MTTLLKRTVENVSPCGQFDSNAEMKNQDSPDTESTHESLDSRFHGPERHLRC
jgi:hypothetical protein